MQHGNNNGYAFAASAISKASLDFPSGNASGLCSAMNRPISAVSGIISPDGNWRTSGAKPVDNSITQYTRAHAMSCLLVLHCGVLFYFVLCVVPWHCAVKSNVVKRSIVRFDVWAFEKLN